MKFECPPIEEFEQLMTLASSDPRRGHLVDCPRCRARLLAFASFMAIEPLPDGIRVDDARRKLTEAIQREVGAPRPIADSRVSLWSWFRSGHLAWRPALAVACAVVVMGIGAYRLVVWNHPPEVVLRDSSPAATVGTPLTSAPDATGGIRVRWVAIPHADVYRLHFYSADLKEVAAIDAGHETTLLLTRDRLAQLGSPGSPTFWRVASIRNGDEVSLSPPATLILP